MGVTLRVSLVILLQDGSFAHALPAVQLHDIVVGEKSEIFGKTKW